KDFSKWGLHSVIIGQVTDDKLLRVKNKGKVVAEIPANTLVLGGEAPVYKREKKKPKYLAKTSKLDLTRIKIPSDLNGAFLNLISTPNISSKRWVYEQYDTMVRTGTAVGPGSDAAVIRLRKSNKALAMSTDCNGRYCYLNPRMGGRIAVAEAARNLVCSGAKPLAITNCLNFGDPYDPEVYWTFTECVAGMADSCKTLDTPVTGGNVSFYNEDPERIVYPTPVVGMIGLIEDTKDITTQWFKKEGDLIVLLGKNKEELGGSEYLKVIHNLVKGEPPVLDLKYEREIQKTCLQLIKKGVVKSAHDCSEGGLAVALAECCISSGDGSSLGAEIKLNDNLRTDALLFGETQSRIILSLEEDNLAELEKIIKKNNVDFVVLGKVGGKNLKINEWIDLSVDAIKERFYNAIPAVVEKRY
ncbi:MAG: AIR synthase related protein, partial [candidate division Zixibacteria bacterium]|nr:AIR synthase related protein [candidate division Zixibacteria bacterium]